MLPTISEFYLSHFTPIWILGRSLDEKTHSSYAQSVALWKLLTTDPPIDQITGKMIGEFMEALKAHPGKKRGSFMMAASRGKHAIQLDTILKMAGPQSRHNRCGQELLPREPPFFNAPKVRKRPPHKDFTVAEIRAMYSACHVMKTPRVEGVAARQWWEALLVVGYYTGLRIFALTHVQFSNIHGQWLDVPDEISKGDRGICCWLPKLAMEHIERIRTDREEILHVPNWPTRRRLLYCDFEQLQEAAAVAKERRWRFHSIRSTHVTQLANLSAGHQEDLRTAQKSVGHASLSITTDFYASGDQELLRVAEAVERMPSPCPPEPEVEVALVELPPKKSPPAAARWHRQEAFVD